MRYFLTLNILSLAVVGLVAAQPAWAAELRFVAEKQDFQRGEWFTVKVLLDTDGEAANGVEGEVFLPESLLDLQAVQDGDSAINFWVEKPTVTTTGSLVFAGVTPGGFDGNDELLFSLRLRAGEVGIGNIQLLTGQVLLNDGQGTARQLLAMPFDFSITQGAASLLPDTGSEIDTEPPEAFAITVSSDPNVFNGRKFLVFSTQDKGSGIGHYEVREGVLGQFVVAESPYMLQNQSMEQQLSVKAIDNAGNERTVVMEPSHGLSDEQRRALIGAILVMSAVSILFLVIWIIWIKFRK